MYLDSELSGTGQQHAHALHNFVHSLPTPYRRAVEQVRHDVQTRHWQSESLSGLELIEKQISIDSDNGNKSLPGKLLFTFIELTSDPNNQQPSMRQSSGLAAIAFAQQSIACMARCDVAHHRLELRIDERRFREQLSRYLDKPVGQIKLTFTPAQDARYGDSLYLMVKTLRDLHAIGAHPSTLKQQGDAILTALVYGPFHNYSKDCIEEIQPPSLTRVRNVTTHIESHLKEALTLDDLAKVAGCGIRSLQVAFDKHLGQSPLEYLRIQRLEAAHQVLCQGECSVTEVAYHYAFSNPGRFAKAFQDRFGKRPSDVLRQH